MNWNSEQWLYAILTLLGGVSTWYFNLQFFAVAEDASMSAFIAQTGTTLPAQSINADIAVASVTFLIWMWIEGRRLGVKRLWLFTVLTFLVAFAFSFPLFLFFREQRLRVLEGKMV